MTIISLMRTGKCLTYWIVIHAYDFVFAILHIICLIEGSFAKLISFLVCFQIWKY